MKNVAIARLADQPAERLAEAAGLYWDAFSGKLGRLLGPDERALVLLARSIQPDHALAAVAADGRLVAVAGFRTPRGSFLYLRPAHLTAVYGPIGGRWRAAALRWLGQDVDNRRFLIDGLAVRADWRSRGIGSALIEALADEARRLGYQSLRLDVADNNTRARALYERNGFDPAGHQRLWLLAPLFGMRGSTVMERRL